MRLVDSSGEEGWGEVPAGEGPWYSEETVHTAWLAITRWLHRLVPREPEPESFQEAARRVRGHRMAKAGIDMALWDLRARLAGEPLYRAIGGEERPVPVGVSIGIQPSLDELVRLVGRYIERGYRRVKIKIKPGWDVEAVRRLRREYPEVPLQVDANAAYSLLDWPRLRQLDEHRLLMIEQPLHYEDLVDHAELRRLLETPICLDESIRSPLHARWALQLGSADIVNLKPARVGGVTPSLEIHRLWSIEAGRPLWIGGMLETGIGRAFQVALGTLPGVRFPSDIGESSRYYKRDIIREPWVLEPGGYLRPRRGPGIGVEVDWSALGIYTRRRWAHRLGG